MEKSLGRMNIFQNNGGGNFSDLWGIITIWK